MQRNVDPRPGSLTAPRRVLDAGAGPLHAVTDTQRSPKRKRPQSSGRLRIRSKPRSALVLASRQSQTSEAKGQQAEARGLGHATGRYAGHVDT